MFPDPKLGIPESVDEVEFFERLVADLDENSDQADRLFPDEWVHATAGYSSFLEFVDAGFDDYETIGDIPTDEMDAWVDEQTTFDSWEEMQRSAALRWVEREFTE